MSKRSSAASTYLKFLNLVQAVRAEPNFPALDPVEERLLNHFAAAWHTGRPLTVVEAMSKLSDLSPATVHRRLTALREKGLVTFDADPTDKRVKYVVGTDKAAEYFARLDNCLKLAKGFQ